MSFQVALFSVSKRINSTKTPTGGDLFNCVLKKPSEILHPIIELDTSMANPKIYNYAIISEFWRCYYVTKWTFSNSLWIAELEVDVLASWRVQIQSLSRYVLRSSSMSNLDIKDTTYPAMITTELIEQNKTSPWAASFNDGCYIVGILGFETNYFIFSLGQLAYFFTYLFSDDYADAVLGNWLTLFPEMKATLNPLQYISSVKWFPFSATGTPYSTVRVGWVNVVVDCLKVNSNSMQGGSITWDTIIQHTQATRGTYLNDAPYSSYSILFPPWGLVQLDSNLVSNSTSIICSYEVCKRSGTGVLTVTNQQGHVFTRLSALVAVDIQIAQKMSQDAGITSVFSTAGAALHGNIAGALQGIGDFAQARIPSATTVGGSGGMESLSGSPSLQYEFRRIADEDLDRRGRPLCEVVTLSSLQGFIQVSNPSVDFEAFKEELEAINAFLEGGFYNE